MKMIFISWLIMQKWIIGCCWLHFKLGNLKGGVINSTTDFQYLYWYTFVVELNCNIHLQSSVVIGNGRSRGNTQYLLCRTLMGCKSHMEHCRPGFYTMFPQNCIGLCTLWIFVGICLPRPVSNLEEYVTKLPMVLE